MKEAEETPRPAVYNTIAGLQVGQVAVELADRVSFTRTDDTGTPRAKKARVLSLGVRGDIETRAEAMALAAAIEAFAGKLDGIPEADQVLAAPSPA